MYSIFPILKGFKKEKFRHSFNQYKSAILKDNGEKAARFVDSKTINYYNDILKKTIESDSLTISKLSLMDKLMVLTIRHKVPKEMILLFDGKGLFIHAINDGMVGKNSVVNNAIGTVSVEDGFAKGQLIMY